MAKRKKPSALKQAGRSYRVAARHRDADYRMPSGFTYSTNKSPCADSFDKLKRGKCLTQLAFDRGKPVLRFCETKGKPGRLVPVESAREAAAIARRGCECFEVTGGYDRCLPRDLRLGAAMKGARRGRSCVLRRSRKAASARSRAG